MISATIGPRTCWRDGHCSARHSAVTLSNGTAQRGLQRRRQDQCQTSQRAQSIGRALITGTLTRAGVGRLASSENSDRMRHVGSHGCSEGLVRRIRGLFGWLSSPAIQLLDPARAGAYAFSCGYGDSAAMPLWVSSGMIPAGLEAARQLGFSRLISARGAVHEMK